MQGEGMNIDTRRAAHEANKPNAQAQRRMIAEYVSSQGVYGSTCDQAEVALTMIHQTASARITEMKKSGQLIPSGEVRPTRTGCKAVVFIAAPGNPGIDDLFGFLAPGVTDADGEEAFVRAVEELS